jgi:Zn-finger nucleic acid-binding protein
MQFGRFCISEGDPTQGDSLMKCPIDGTALVIAERSGVEIDYCPQCRGVWLDRGELDKIIERSASYAAPPPPPAAPQPMRGASSGYEDTRYHKKKKRGGFLEDLFDF